MGVDNVAKEIEKLLKRNKKWKAVIPQDLLNVMNLSINSIRISMMKIPKYDNSFILTRVRFGKKGKSNYAYWSHWKKKNQFEAVGRTDLLAMRFQKPIILLIKVK